MTTTPMDQLAQMGFDQMTLQEAVLTALANDERARLPKGSPTVLPALYTYMKPDLIAAQNGQVMLIHEKPLPAAIWWADYDPELKQLIFVTITGQIMDLGIKIPPVIDGFLRAGRDIVLVEIDLEGNILNVQDRKIVVRQTASMDVGK